MPELPEVETVKKTLQKLVVGKTIADVTVLWPRIVKLPDDVEEFRIRLIGQTIQDIGRRGKFLKLMLDEDVIVSHLRMEGRYTLSEHGEPHDKHTHVIFTFTDQSELRYRDVRKFGTMHVFARGEEEKHLPLSHLGPEPLGRGFTAAYLAEKLAKTVRNVKAVLLDQTVVAGLGNIYVDESLFRARIHPQRPGNTLTEAEIVRLHRAARKTLREAVTQGGSTIRTYVNGHGEMGMFQQSLFVYARRGEPCKVCGTELEKQVVAGRGTHYCPNCQPLEREEIR
ncbi:MAG TPA: DNA-formamidopyrimidine glycosylase [Bacillales bacterium]|nr:DNA-formamidopyrimidine glycosylase [Bacillales bacterium]